MLLVLAAPRSGTHYIVKVLRALGVMIRHERIGRDGIASWYAAAAEGKLFDYTSADVWCKTTVLFHQLRNPLKAIPSMTTASRHSRAYAAQHARIPGCSRIQFAARWWLAWNRMISECVPKIVPAQQSMVYQVEKLLDPYVFEEFCRLAGAPIDREKVRAIPKDVDSRKDRYKPVCSWEEFKCRLEDDSLYAEVRDLAEAYGYR